MPSTEKEPVWICCEAIVNDWEFGMSCRSSAIFDSVMNGFPRRRLESVNHLWIAYWWMRLAAGSVYYGDIQKRSGERTTRSSHDTNRSNVRSSKRLPHACGPAGCWSIVPARRNRKKTKPSSSDSVVPMRSFNANPSSHGYRPRRRGSSLNEAPFQQWETGTQWTDFTQPG